MNLIRFLKKKKVRLFFKNNRRAFFALFIFIVIAGFVIYSPLVRIKSVEITVDSEGVITQQELQSSINDLLEKSTKGIPNRFLFFVKREMLQEVLQEFFVNIRFARLESQTWGHFSLFIQEREPFAEVCLTEFSDSTCRWPKNRKDFSSSCSGYVDKDGVFFDRASREAPYTLTVTSRSNQEERIQYIARIVEFLENHGYSTSSIVAGFESGCVDNYKIIVNNTTLFVNYDVSLYETTRAIYVALEEVFADAIPGYIDFRFGDSIYYDKGE